MRKIASLVVASILAVVLMAASNVSAIGIAKILSTDWLVTTTARFYDSSGYYDGVIAGGQGIMYIDSDYSVYLEHAPMVAADPTDSMAVPGSTMSLALYDYTYRPAKNRLRSDSCDVVVYDPYGEEVYSYSGPCTAGLTFATPGEFEGTITFTDEDDEEIVVTITGRKLGQYPDGGEE